jgi:hypothetical protein
MNGHSSRARPQRGRNFSSRSKRPRRHSRNVPPSGAAFSCSVHLGLGRKRPPRSRRIDARRDRADARETKRGCGSPTVILKAKLATRTRRAGRTICSGSRRSRRAAIPALPTQPCAMAKPDGLDANSKGARVLAGRSKVPDILHRLGIR